MKNFDRRELLKIGLMYGFLNPSLNVAANEQSAFLLDQKYGTHEKQVFDIFFTEKKESPVVVFIKPSVKPSPSGLGYQRDN